jgi:hypothetical protein
MNYINESGSKLLIGNKSDRDDKVVSTEKGQEYAQELEIPFLETSAKTAANVEAAFLAMASELIKSRDASAKAGGGAGGADGNGPAFVLTPNANAGAKSGCCK